MSVQRRFPPRIGFAILLIAIGTFLLLDKMDVYDFGDLVRTWWPLILIYISVQQFMNSGKANKTWAFILLIAGVIFLLRNLDFLDRDLIHTYWPVIFLIAGLLILFDSFRKQSVPVFTGQTTDENFIQINNVFTGSKQSFHSQALEGGVISTVFGGAEIDLRNCKLAANSNLDLTCVFGGVTLFVPQDWNILFVGSPIFGGFNDSRFQGNIDPNKVLKITGVIVFGGGEIKM